MLVRRVDGSVNIVVVGRDLCNLLEWDWDVPGGLIWTSHEGWIDKVQIGHCGAVGFSSWGVSAGRGNGSVGMNWRVVFGIAC